MSDVERILSLVRDHAEYFYAPSRATQHAEALIEDALRDLVAERDFARNNAAKLAATLVRVEVLESQWTGCDPWSKHAEAVRDAIAGGAR